MPMISCTVDLTSIWDTAYPPGAIKRYLRRRSYQLQRYCRDTVSEIALRATDPHFRQYGTDNHLHRYVAKATARAARR